MGLQLLGLGVAHGASERLLLLSGLEGVAAVLQITGGTWVCHGERALVVLVFLRRLRWWVIIAAIMVIMMVHN